MSTQTPTRSVPARLGLVVHPSRPIDEPLRTVREWAGSHSVDLAQVPAPCQQQAVAEQSEASECELIVSIGGDGTMLAALRAAGAVGRPVLGVAFGSLGVLTSVAEDELSDALDRFAQGDWVPRALPALEVAREGGEDLSALNDVALVRSAPGQLSITARVDEDPYAQFVGDGCIVSTPIGSSAYALAAGGPLLSADTEAFLLTPLTIHGGSCPPLVVPAKSTLELSPHEGHTGGRLEVDGQLVDTRITKLHIALRPGAATVVTLPGQETFLAGLRRRRIITDSPRILAEGARD